MTPGPSHVAILLGLRDGEGTLGEQLDSYTAQTHDDWSLLVSDDGSTDDSRAIVEAFAAAHADRMVTLVEGPQRGFALNFLSLLARAPQHADFAALSDQDDVWMPKKLSRAVRRLGALPSEVPALYVSRTLVCDRDLRPIGLSPLFRRSPSFANAMVQSIGGGNTMVLNRRAIDMVRDVAPGIGELVAHDWWLYQLIAGAGGIVVYDPEPSVHYRQHDRNAIGANTLRRAARHRLRRVLRGEFRAWNDSNIAALRVARRHLTDASLATLAEMERARHGNPVQRLVHLRRAGLHRQSLRDDLALYVSAVLGKL